MIVHNTNNRKLHLDTHWYNCLQLAEQSIFSRRAAEHFDRTVQESIPFREIWL